MRLELVMGLELLTMDEIAPGLLRSSKQRQGLCSHPRCDEPAVIARYGRTSGLHLKCRQHAKACGIVLPLVPKPLVLNAAEIKCRIVEAQR